MAIVLPPSPALEPADTYSARHRVWWEQCDVLLRDDRTAAERELAVAQQAVATGMQASVAMLGQPIPERLPTRAQLAFAVLRDHPQATLLTNGQIVNGCKAIVDAYVAAYPNAVQA